MYNHEQLEWLLDAHSQEASASVGFGNRRRRGP